MKFKIGNDEIGILNGTKQIVLPKYTSQLINLANQNAQGTRPVVVGQLSELFPKYKRESYNISVAGWREWYLEYFPNAMEEATEKIYEKLENLKEAINLIDREMIRDWVEDLVVSKTYNGLSFQEAILRKLASIKGKEYRMANPSEESMGIDGYVGDIPYSIKPDSYKTMNRLSEAIDVEFIYYTKSKTGLYIEVEE